MELATGLNQSSSAAHVYIVSGDLPKIRGSEFPRVQKSEGPMNRGSHNQGQGQQGQGQSRGQCHGQQGQSQSEGLLIMTLTLLTLTVTYQTKM